MWDENRKDRLRVAVYMRVATKEQNEDACLAMERQEALLENLVEGCGNTVAGRFRDYASGIRYDRPGLSAALEAVNNGRADALLVKDYARLGRDAFLTEEIVRRLRDKGKRVFFADSLAQGGMIDKI